MAYSKYRISHNKELYYISCIVALVVILFFSILGPSGYRDLRKSRLELQLLRAHVNDLKHSNSERAKTIKSFQTDQDAVEKYAREKGYGRAGEIVQEVPREPEKKAK
jgi:cell division protein FtsB